jgi:hypothetical protein
VNPGCIAIVSIQGGKERRIARNIPHITGIAWLPDQSGFVITSWPAATKNGVISILSYPGGKLRKITSDLASYGGAGITQDPRRLSTWRS